MSVCVCVQVCCLLCFLATCFDWIFPFALARWLHSPPLAAARAATKDHTKALLTALWLPPRRLQRQPQIRSRLAKCTCDSAAQSPTSLATATAVVGVSISPCPGPVVSRRRRWRPWRRSIFEPAATLVQIPTLDGAGGPLNYYSYPQPFRSIRQHTQPALSSLFVLLFGVLIASARAK